MWPPPTVATNRGSVNTLGSNTVYAEVTPYLTCLGRGRNARNSPLPLRSQNLIYYSRLSPHRAETLQKCRSTSSRTDCLAAADQRPLVTAMESRRSRRGPISTVLSSLQGGRVAVKRDVEELRKNMLVLPGTKIQYMKDAAR